MGQAVMSMCVGRVGRVGFQGVEGAYSHQAARLAYPDAELVACGRFDDAFLGVEQGDYDAAMIPIENTRGGRVAEIHHLLNETSLYITGELFLPIHHYLLALPGATLKGITRVRSHPQALAQCRNFVRQMGVVAEATADTAGAAESLSQTSDLSVAAIASELAGEIYGLEVLKQRIEDNASNTTRFVVLARTLNEPDPSTSNAITSIIFQVRSRPAALYKALGGFATNGVNMVKLESYLVDDKFSAARFYLEVEGHVSHEAVRYSIEELQMFSSYFRIVGCYTAASYRES